MMTQKNSHMITLSPLSNPPYHARALIHLKTLLQRIKIYRLCKKKHFDIAYILYAKPIVFGGFACFLANIKRRVAMLPGLGFAFTQRPHKPSYKTKFLGFILRLLWRFSLPLLHHIIFLNRDDYLDITQKYAFKVQEHHILGGIGVDLQKYAYSPPSLSPIRFIFVGRLLKDKGVKEFIEAANDVVRQNYHADFFIYGAIDNDNPESLSQQQFDDLNDSGAVQCKNFVSDIVYALQESSVFVLPSYREGVPRSSQEAMAVGRAMITTNVPGCRETIIDGHNGFMIEPFHSEILAEKMIYFINHPHDITNMGRKSHEIAHEKFNQINVTKRLIKMILQKDYSDGN